jgi:hypothetical protein
MLFKYPESSVADGKVTDEQLQKMFVGQSAVGGIVVVDGIFEAAGGLDRKEATEVLAMAFSANGIWPRVSQLINWPFCLNSSLLLPPQRG